MPLGTPYITTTVPSKSGDVTVPLTGGQAQTQFGGSVEVPVASQPMAMMRNGQIVQAEKDAPIVTDTALLTALKAGGAPLTLVAEDFTFYAGSAQIGTLFGQTI